MTSVRQRESLARSRLISRIARVDLRVQDVERALRFYCDVVGLGVVDRVDSEVLLGDGAADAFLRLDTGGVTRPAEPTATGLFHTAFRFPTRAALGDVLARLVAADYPVGAGDHLVSEALYVDDPDGNGVELYWDRPTEQWPAPTGEAIVPMATLPVDLDGLYRAGRGTEAVGEAAPAGTDIGHVHLQVSDIAQTVRFYGDVLGLDLTGRMGQSAGFFSSNGYHHHIGANTWRSHGAKPAPKDRAGLERVVFGVPDGNELEDLRSRLRTSAHDFTGSGSEVVARDGDDIELRFQLAH